MNRFFTVECYLRGPRVICARVSTEKNMTTKTITLKFATVTKTVIGRNGWERTRGLTALALDETHGHTVERFESLDELDAWLKKQGFVWIANSRGRYTSLLPLAA